MDKRERVARAICAEKCAFMGEPPCYTVAIEWPNPNCSEPGCHAEAQAAIAALEPVKVKPLEWEYHPAGAIAAPPTGHAYIIDTRTKGRVYSIKGFNPQRQFASMDEAKAAAQADYERRILDALEPGKPVTVQEAARVLTEGDVKERLIAGGQIVYSMDGDEAWLADDTGEIPERVVISLRRQGLLKRMGDPECPRGIVWDEASDKLRALAEQGGK